MALMLLAGCGKPLASGPFAQASEVRLYINEGMIDVASDGKLNDGSFPAGGIALTAVEFADLRKAAGFTTWKSGPKCCIPRHAFVFYDDVGKYLGSLEVCFECGCSFLDGGLQPPFSQVKWDEAVFERIVKAHGQKTVFDGAA
ncbi:hypothetical protein ABI_29910 [Asticcacaulis biprosthecium C19]|uniref:Uncharacterized protein n=2 Tax=Asticcacaulis biprosthecium TaxID=76891 RepID=F4QMY3_9CAUL|nr:hypothetical protein ABI_29910 [Asticcacaulis biprosthecium C19]